MNAEQQQIVDQEPLESGRAERSAWVESLAHDLQYVRDLIRQKLARILSGLNPERLVPTRMRQKELAGTVDERVDRLIREGLESQPVLDQILNEVGDATAADRVIHVSAKSRDRCIENCETRFTTRGGKVNVELLNDVIRGSVVYDRLEDLYAGLEVLSHHPLVKKVYFKDRVGDPFEKSPLESGYRDLVANIELQNGHVAEVQFHIREMIDAKQEGLQVPLDLLQGLDFSAEELDLVEKMGFESEMLRTIVQEGYIHGHDLYSLLRLFPRHPEGVASTLQSKLYKLSIICYDFAWSSYIQRDTSLISNT